MSVDVRGNGSKKVHLADEARRRWRVAMGALTVAILANAALVLWLPSPMDGVNIFLAGVAVGLILNVYWGRP